MAVEEADTFVFVYGRFSREGGLTVKVEGRGGEVEFDGHFVTIRHKGALGRITVGKGDKRIPITSITSVQIKPAGAMVNGFIQFSIPGGNESRSGFGTQTLDAAGDENSVIFTKQQEPKFLALRDAIENAMVSRLAPQPQLIATQPAISKLDELKKLADLRDAGVLSEEEFSAEKARIMSGSETAEVSPGAEPINELDSPEDISEEKAKGGISAGRIAGFMATGGASEVARFAKKKWKDR